MTYKELTENPTFKHWIIRNSRTDFKYIILRCDFHQCHFGPNDNDGAAQGAGRHLIIKDHKVERTKKNAFNILGIEITDCTPKLMEENNKEYTRTADEDGYTPYNYHKRGPYWEERRGPEDWDGPEENANDERDDPGGDSDHSEDRDSGHSGSDHEPDHDSDRGGHLHPESRMVTLSVKPWALRKLLAAESEPIVIDDDTPTPSSASTSQHIEPSAGDSDSGPACDQAINMTDKLISDLRALREAAEAAAAGVSNPGSQESHPPVQTGSAPEAQYDSRSFTTIGRGATVVDTGRINKTDATTAATPKPKPVTMARSHPPVVVQMDHQRGGGLPGQAQQKSAPSTSPGLPTRTSRGIFPGLKWM